MISPRFMTGKWRTPVLVSVCMTTTVALSTVLLGEGNVSHAAKDAWKPYPILASCGRSDAEYANLFFRTQPFDEWVDAYHSRVSSVVEEYVNPPQATIPACLEDNLFPISPASQLGLLAKELPPWQSDADFQKLDRNDIGLVLLEFLRIYECALTDYHSTLPMEIAKERREAAEEGGPASVLLENFSYWDLVEDMEERQNIIFKETATARPALERTLAVVGSISRLEPLSAEFECLQRASLDLRNGFALTAEASSCLPKAWDIKDPLRDLQAPGEETGGDNNAPATQNP